MKFKFTFVTLFYKGTKFLDNLKSNIEQASLNHRSEWIIVDDFSDDEEAYEKLKSISRDAKIPTSLIFLKKNYLGSKSLKKALEIAKGEYIIILDQDDEIYENGLDVFDSLLLKYSSEENIAGVCARCDDINRNLIGNRFKHQDFIAFDQEVRLSLKEKAEFFQCTQADLLRDHVDDYKVGYTNGFLWNRISRSHRFIYTNNIVRTYKYNEDSVTNTTNLSYVNAQFEQQLEYITDNWDYIKNINYRSFKILVQFCRIAIHSHLSLNKTKKLMSKKSYFYINITWSIGKIRVYIDKLKNIRVTR